MRKLKESPIAVMLLVTVAAVILVGAAWYWGPQHLTAKHVTITNKGSFGDTYGTVNALFAGLAFAILLGTIVGQMMELRYHRDELRSTREQLQGQKEQLQAQSETLRLQRFEDTFFQLLRLHIDIVSALSMREDHSPRIQEGKRCLWDKKRRLSEELWDSFSDVADVKRRLELHRQVINDSCEKLFHSSGAEPRLEHYFRQLYHIIRFVHDSDHEDKPRYMNFVQAQLDDDELVLLAYYGLSQHGQKLRVLIEEYGLLGNLPSDALFHEEHCGLYSAAAFRGVTPLDHQTPSRND